MYETPIKIIMADTEYTMEGEIFKAIQRYGIDVNKEELLKALQYDRDQYNKGYQDGLNADKWIPCSERLPNNNDDVLVQLEDGYMRTDFMKANFSGWFLTEEDELPVAWQPLPAPYKGEQE